MLWHVTPRYEELSNNLNSSQLTSWNFACLVQAKLYGARLEAQILLLVVGMY